MKLLFLWLLIVNALTYFVYWLDKRRALSGSRRVRERELLLWALLGGSPAAIVAMRRTPLKTQKLRFKVALGVVVALQLVGVWFLFH